MTKNLIVCAFALTTIMTACALATPTLDARPFIEAIEGTSVAFATFTPTLIRTISTGAAPATVASPVATNLIIVGPAVTSIGINPPSATVPISRRLTTSTPDPTAPPGAARTPLPTANPSTSLRTGLTPLPTLTPRAPTATTSLGRPSLTASPTPSHTPTATAVSVCRSAAQRPPADVGWIVENMCLYLSSADTSWIVFGELTNNTGGDLSFVGVEVTFFSGNGVAIAQDFNWIDAETMPDGATLPFAVLIDSIDAPAQIGFEMSGDVAGRRPRQDLGWDWLERVSGSNTVFLSGQVTNAGPALDEYAEVIATFTDQNGAVVAVGHETIDAAELEPFETASFRVVAVAPQELIGLIFDYAVVIYGY